MNMRSYLCIDLKSFYASVECIERNLDPMTTRLVVADPERTEKTICLAVSPAMKALGVRNRCRLFEIPQNTDYVVAPPRMQLYIDYSARIYGIYLKYVAKEDIHVYSIDEVFMDVTEYIGMYAMTPRELGLRIMEDVLSEVGIPATCGIGTNLYLAKIALDITAKHAPDRIGELDEDSYCRTLWDYRPLTDFWRIGPGIARRLEGLGIFTMRGLATADEEALYRLFGVDAELLIDHAYGREPVTIADIKAYHSKQNCLSSGQVLPCGYSYENAALIVKEMADLLCLDLVEHDLAAESATLHISYENGLLREAAHGTVAFTMPTSSARMILTELDKLYARIADSRGGVRRVNLTFNKVKPEENVQYSLFVDAEELEREKKVQKAMVAIKKKYGKNAVLKGMNLEEGATTRERNRQIGGHRSG